MVGDAVGGPGARAAVRASDRILARTTARGDGFPGRVKRGKTARRSPVGRMAIFVAGVMRASS